MPSPADPGDTLDLPAAPRDPTAEPELRAAGEALGGYRIVSTLGAGGMGTVYVAESTSRGPVALKVLRRALAENPRAVARFLAEAEAVRRVRHRALVEVHELFVVDGTPCIAMELLTGRTLAAALEEGPLPAARVAAIGCDVAGALAAAHEAGVVHRDIKPANVFLVHALDPMPFPASSASASSVKVIDFGVAQLAPGAAWDGGGASAIAGGASAVDAPGAIVGTPAYMAPEQLAGGAVDARADVYALGVTLYRAVAGHAPFAGQSVGDYVVKHLTQPAPALDGSVPPALARAIEAMLAKDARDRPATMHDVGALLAAAL